MYNEKYVEAKIDLYNTNVYGNKTSIEVKHYTCFSVILFNSIVNADKEYLQTFLKECK